MAASNSTRDQRSRDSERRAAARAPKLERDPEGAAAARARATEQRGAARARQRQQDPGAAAAEARQNTLQHAAVREQERAVDLRGPERLPRTHGCALGLAGIAELTPLDLGPMSVVCAACGALHFACETGGDGGRYQSCCEVVKVVLSALAEMPEEMRRLFAGGGVGEDAAAKARRTHFLKNVRAYNGAMAFASVVCKTELFRGRGPQSYKVQGQMYHYLAPAHPLPDRAPCFGQLYFVDTEQAVGHQLQQGGQAGGRGPLRQDVLRILQDTIRRVNPYAQRYMQAAEIEESCRVGGQPVPELAIVFGQANQPRVRNLGQPVAGEVAALIDDGGQSEPHEVAVRLRHSHGCLLYTSPSPRDH
jgi:hypothetical protein